MFSNLLLAVTTIIYFALCLFVFQTIDASGVRMIGWRYIAFALMAAYVISSLLLTISVTAKGGFNWVSGSSFKRNSTVAILWFGLAAAVVICMYAKSEFPKGHQTSVLPGLLSYPYYFGAAWLPLLMLVPYALIINPQWHDGLSPAFYKIPLVTGCVMGLLLLAAPKFIAAAGISDKYKSEKEIKDALKKIEHQSSATLLLPYTNKYENERVRTAANNKIKTLSNLDAELIQVLEEENAWYFNLVYIFLTENKVEHMERFVKPVNNSIPLLASTLQHEVLENPWKGEGLDMLLDAGPLLRLLDLRFKDSSGLFKANILKLQHAMQTQPAKRDDEQQFLEALHKYQFAVNNWLHKN